jgi:hypothetical protein
MGLFTTASAAVVVSYSIHSDCVVLSSLGVSDLVPSSLTPQKPPFMVDVVVWFHVYLGF